MITLARPQTSTAAHWYDPKSGQPKHSVAKADGKGVRPTTLADAKKLGLLPSVTSIINKVLRKPQLEAWMQEQACLAVLTSSQKEGELLDEYVKRVLSDEKQHEEEAKRAADLGTAIHEAIEKSLQGQPYDMQLMPYVMVAEPLIRQLGAVREVEKIVVGIGYAGKMDVLLESSELITVLDIKTCKTVPKSGSWTEHLLQTAAYAKTIGNTSNSRIQTGNLYLSTVTMGEAKVFLQQDWVPAANAFDDLVRYWSWANDYDPAQLLTINLE